MEDLKKLNLLSNHLIYREVLGNLLHKFYYFLTPQNLNFFFDLGVGKENMVVDN